ncbi:hypothetical protein Y900_030250 [Mycolicibacterium aromaticivorans JS19b1 = JCM 16368]|uniref:Uncharacterized protein n=1 Tax=Mycolicibacterium aromaticivorans JS19b1 = JCM 16368 TaxID=1440774 RepID=A0A064CDT9_9MYCO|nr:hypothetical protein [Mycolicibacterium aromaticivorans]KDE96917.1 hypothetical protein Y900_030250 [Mycolicibacterium aromaticivorans JS19b1 = JCM 16368]
MSVNRPYVFELARQLLTALDHDAATEQHLNGIDLQYANAERNGVDRATLDRAAHTLLKLAPADIDEWIRQEYIVDGWLRGYLPLTTDPTDPNMSTWKLSQLADAHYRNAM